MADKQLSQAEIDALLNSLTSGAPAAKEDEGPKIRKYDFKSPKKFTKEQLRTLDGLYENFSRMLSSFLSGILRQFCEVTVLSIEEQRFFEYNNALPDSALIGKIDLKPADKHYSDGYEHLSGLLYERTALRRSGHQLHADPRLHRH